MFEAVMNLLLMAAGTAVTVFWIATLVNYDGKCHQDSCEGCPFEDSCPVQKEREEDEDS